MPQITTPSYTHVTLHEILPPGFPKEQFAKFFVK